MHAFLKDPKTQNNFTNMKRYLLVMIAMISVLLSLSNVSCCIAIRRKIATRKVENEIKPVEKKKRKRISNAAGCGELGVTREDRISDQNLTKIVGGELVTENEIPWQV